MPPQIPSYSDVLQELQDTKRRLDALVEAAKNVVRLIDIVSHPEDVSVLNDLADAIQQAEGRHD